METVSMLKEENRDENFLLEEGQGDAENIKESRENISNSSPSPSKRGRGRPKKLKESDQQVWTASSKESAIPPLKERGSPKRSAQKQNAHESVGVCEESGTDTANDGPLQPLRGRGRPNGSAAKKRIVLTVSSEEGSGSETFVNNESPMPKGPISKKRKVEKIADVASIEDSGENSSSSPNPSEKGRGRPKRSIPEELTTKSAASSEEEDSRSMPLKKRGRPKGSLSKTVILKDCSVRIEELDFSDGNSTVPKKGRGRPKSSSAREAPTLKVYVKPRKKIHLPSSPKRGRPTKEVKPRGRPRKNPLSPDNEINKHKTKLSKGGKPLGRPHVYPEAESPAVVGLKERRSRGRPRKNSSIPAKIGSPSSPDKNTGDVPRKRGRPKGSVKAVKVDAKGELDCTPQAKQIQELNGRDTLTPGPLPSTTGLVKEEEELENGETQELVDTEPECGSQMVEDADESEEGFAPLEESDLSVLTDSSFN